MPQQRVNVTSPVLVTGASGGIGTATCVRLLAKGHVVYATARRPEALEALSLLGCRALRADLTDETSLEAALATIRAEAGPLGVLVNNAGYGLYGPIEQTSISQVREEFETNVFGLFRLVQLALPGMRALGGGRIVNISSIGGRMTFPGGAFYHASKFALEALSDTLRLEVAPFNVKVVIVEPGPVRTNWAMTAASTIPLESEDTDGSPDPYADYKSAIASMLISRSGEGASRVESSVDDVAKVIVRAVSSRRPRTRYVVGVPTRALLAVRRLLSDRTYDALLRKQFGVPGPSSLVR